MFKDVTLVLAIALGFLVQGGFGIAPPVLG